MNAPMHARAKTARERAPSAPSPRPPGRPKSADPVREYPTINVRLEPALLARLDAIVARRNRELATQGASTSRLAVAALALREFCDREEAEAAKGGPQ